MRAIRRFDEFIKENIDKTYAERVIDFTKRIYPKLKAKN